VLVAEFFHNTQKLEDYDEMDSWPLLIDNFVYHLKDASANN
jgi:hypothetical protein